MINPKILIDRYNKNQKINYDKVFQDIMNYFDENKIKPKILLHSCCAPCSTTAIDYLSRQSDLMVYFYNQNIHPENEYEKRKSAQQKFIDSYNKINKTCIKFESEKYNDREFFEKVKGLEDEKEGGVRCSVCFADRLEKTAKRAKEEGYDYFTTTITLGPQKNSELINKIGFNLQDKYNIYYLPADFKKREGFKKSLKMCEYYDIYRQCYCGCVYSNNKIKND